MKPGPGSLTIIAGTAKGRRLRTVPGESTRPTASKVRGALFNVLAAWVPGGCWLDLYAGSGAIGLEAASRGARQVVFVERARSACEAIAENMARVGGQGIQLVTKDVAVALEQMAGERFDVVFMDPPYAVDPITVMSQIARLGYLARAGRLVVEHASSRTLPDQVAALVKIRVRTYAATALTFYALAEDLEENPPPVD